MRYCSNCGQEIIDGAKFCSNCGVAVDATSENIKVQRNAVFDGAMHKCPICGEVLNAFVSICPACGYELRGAAVANAVKELYDNIRKAKNDKEVIRLIKTFPVPNSKEDILEFMVLASSNFDEEEYAAHSSVENISAAWLSKIEQCHKKASLSLSKEDMLKVNEIYDAISKQVTDAKKKANRKHTLQQSEATTKEFKKSKSRLPLAIFSLISELLCVFAFQDGMILSGVVAILMVVLFLTAFLMCSGVINERIRNLRAAPTILAFLLIIPYFSLSTSQKNPVLNTDSKNTDNYKDDVEQISWETLILGEHLPDFGYNEAEVFWDTDTTLVLYFYNVESSKYKSYIEDCKEYGYTIDSENSGSRYTAYNQDGYHLELYYSDYSDYLSIDLDDPIKSEQIVWPGSDLVKNLPIPKLLIGEVSTETSEAYSVYLVQLEPSYFSEYVSLCMDSGFNKDYSKSDTYFHAENADDISLTVEYKGFNTLYIHVDNYDQ